MSSDRDKFECSRVWNALWQDILQDKRDPGPITFLIQSIVNAPADKNRINAKERQIIEGLKMKTGGAAGIQWQIRRNLDGNGVTLVYRPCNQTREFRIPLNGERYDDRRDIHSKLELFDMPGENITIDLSDDDRLFFFEVYKSVKSKDREIFLGRFTHIF